VEQEAINQATTSSDTSGAGTCTWYWDSGWWTDGYYWTPYGWSAYTMVTNVAAGRLDEARGTLPLVTLGALALIGTAGILIRRNRRHDPGG
jgi:hypothetical protein